jgi:hypothetical protein
MSTIASSYTAPSSYNNAGAVTQKRLEIAAPIQCPPRPLGFPRGARGVALASAFLPVWGVPVVALLEVVAVVVVVVAVAVEAASVAVEAYPPVRTLGSPSLLPCPTRRPPSRPVPGAAWRLRLLLMCCTALCRIRHWSTSSGGIPRPLGEWGCG